AFAGATIMVVGFLMIIDKVNRVEIGNGTAATIINESWWWMIPWIVLVVVGIGSQLSNLRTIILPEEKWTTARM
ncbi:MAG: hypothetical protein ACR2OU_07925, partial [Thermomicrobiales bacterium]